MVTTAAELAGLVAAVAQRRDRAAFTRLFDHFAPRLNGYLVRQGAEPALAEEITQDALATLWRKAALFDPSKSSVSTWLFAIAANACRDRLRSAWRTTSVPLEGVPAAGLFELGGDTVRVWFKPYRTKRGDTP